jgi:hypothetical protein
MLNVVTKDKKFIPLLIRITSSWDKKMSSEPKVETLHPSVPIEQMLLLAAVFNFPHLKLSIFLHLFCS